MFIVLCFTLAFIGTVHADETSERLKHAESVAREARLHQYASDMALAQMAWQLGKLDRATALLERHRSGNQKNETKASKEDIATNDYRGMEWHLLWRMMHAEKMSLINESNPLSALEFSPDDSEIISGERSYTHSKPAAVKARSISSFAMQDTSATDAELKKQTVVSNNTIWTQEATPGQAYVYFSGARSMGLSSDGTKIAVPDNHAVHVIDRTTNKIEWTMSGHTDFISAVAISPNGKLMASGGLDKKLNVWNLESGELVESLPGHEFGIQTVAFSPDSKTLVAGGGDDRAPDWHRRLHGEVKIWTIQSDQEPQTLQVSAAVTSVAYSADQRFIAVGLFDGKTLLADANKVKTLRTIEQSSPVTCVRFSSDSKVLATATTDGLVKLWEVGTGSEVATYRGHRGHVDSLAFSHKGLWLASGGMDRTIRIWDANIHPERTRIPLPAWSIHTVAFTEDSQSLLASDFKRVWLLDPRSNRVRTNWPTNHWTVAAAISPNGMRVATAGQRSAQGGGGSLIRLWNVEDHSKYIDLATPLYSATSATFSKDGRTLFAHCQSQDKADSTVRIYKVDTGELLHAWDAAYHFASSPDGRSVAVALADEIEIYDFQDQKTSAHLSGESARANALRYSPDGEQLASASFDHSLCLWKIASQGLVKTLNGHQQVIEQIQFSPDGKSLATADVNRANLWILSDDAVRFTLPHGSCPMAFTSDNRTLITAPGEVHFWQAATGDELITFPHYGYDSRTVALSPDGQILTQAGGNRDESNGVWIWTTNPLHQ